MISPDRSASHAPLSPDKSEIDTLLKNSPPPIQLLVANLRASNATLDQAVQDLQGTIPRHNQEAPKGEGVDLKEDNARLQAQNLDLQRQLADLQGQHSELQQENHDLSTKNDQLRQENDNLRGANNYLHRLNTSLRNTLNTQHVVEIPKGKNRVQADTKDATPSPNGGTAHEEGHLNGKKQSQASHTRASIDKPPKPTMPEGTNGLTKDSFMNGESGLILTSFLASHAKYLQGVGVEPLSRTIVSDVFTYADRFGITVDTKRTAIKRERAKVLDLVQEISELPDLEQQQFIAALPKPIQAVFRYVNKLLASGKFELLVQVANANEEQNKTYQKRKTTIAS